MKFENRTNETYEGRGVSVPVGLTAREIMEGTKALERGFPDFDFGHYTARAMVEAVLQATRS